MPVVFQADGYRFHFFSREGDPREPVHIHVANRGTGDAKLWLYPEVAIAYNYGFDARTQRWLIAQVTERREEIESAWHEHFGTGNQG
ncbi:DUF4160 domain-containing protein [Sphingomonas qomolangmaensis]|uniref:DUF4160 domain-containing protein n=1 Tax=Sphingomonas qomolangmaensis TaxID=2918765 RepID=A0ABY5L6Z2_9SPHN|nr:DUF4160 domain-containing protein [Sphingomonas qomolangmaensis]UUL81833.1 DUF4160 domain-containing protein [Sphingomonas qomolangmaensis]